MEKGRKTRDAARFPVVLRAHSRIFASKLGSVPGFRPMVEEAFRAAWNAGRAMTEEQIQLYAREYLGKRTEQA